MFVNIIYLALVVVVAVLLAVDISRTPDESSHGQADSHPRDAERAIPGYLPAPGSSLGNLPQPGSRARRRIQPVFSARGTSSPAGPREHKGIWSGTQLGALGELKNWPFRSRLLLLVAISVVATAVVTVSIIHIANSLQGAPIHSDIRSIRDSVIVSAILTGVVMIIVLALALWSMIIVTRSMLGRCTGLRAGAAEMAGNRLPNVVRLINEGGGEGLLHDAKPIGVDSLDEIGDVARAFDLVHKEVLRLAVSEAELRGKLNTMFANLSRRSQGLVERQIRLIDDLEQREDPPSVSQVCSSWTTSAPACAATRRICSF